MQEDDSEQLDAVQKEGVRKGESWERVSSGAGKREHCQLCLLLRTEVGQ